MTEGGGKAGERTSGRRERKVWIRTSNIGHSCNYLLRPTPNREFEHFIRDMEVAYANSPGENENKNRVEEEQEEEQEDSLDENRVLCQLGERVFVIRDPKLGVDRLCKVSPCELNRREIRWNLDSSWRNEPRVY